MNQWRFRLFALGTSAVLLFSACQSQPKQTFLPITGAEAPALPARVQVARDSVMDYLASSSRLAGLPLAEWELDTAEASDTEYRFRSGDWQMLIRHADSVDGNQQIVLFNSVDRSSWTGYVTSDGRVVDTAYAR